MYLVYDYIKISFERDTQVSQTESAYIYYLAAEQGRLVYFALRQQVKAKHCSTCVTTV
jgi:hypothetical protein